MMMMNLERSEYAVVVLRVFADPRVAVVDVRLVDVLIDDLRHHHEPLRQEVRLFTSIHMHISVQTSNSWYRHAKGKGSPYSITECRVPELIPVLGSRPAGDVSHKPGGRLPLLSARPAVTPTTLKRAATNFAAWRTEAQRVWAVCLRLLPDCDLNPGLLHLSPVCSPRGYRATHTDV